MMHPAATAKHQHIFIYLCSTRCLKKVPTFKLSVTCQILNSFQNFCTDGKRRKLTTKPIEHYPPHLRYAATLPWEIKVNVCRYSADMKENVNIAF